MTQCPTCGYALWNYDSNGVTTCKLGHRWTPDGKPTGDHPAYERAEANAVPSTVFIERRLPFWKQATVAALFGGLAGVIIEVVALVAA